jgi:hypothetical protein
MAVKDLAAGPIAITRRHGTCWWTRGERTDRFTFLITDLDGARWFGPWGRIVAVL